MASKRILFWLCSLAVWSSSAAQHESLPQNCSLQAVDLSAALKVAVECGENLPGDAQQRATLLLSLRNLTDALNKQQQRDCHGATPERCPAPEVPNNGGLACVTVANKRYCKPMCNSGYDFAFIRRSRPYDECSEQTRYKWSTQYIGGNTLAVCQEASIQVSGAKTAYFPKDCLTTKSSNQLQQTVIQNLIAELENHSMQEVPQHACLSCG